MDMEVVVEVVVEEVAVTWKEESKDGTIFCIYIISLYLYSSLTLLIMSNNQR